MAPEFAVARIVFALGVLEVIAEVPTGLVVLHVRLTLQLLAPEAMMHEEDAGVRVPAAEKAGRGAKRVKMISNRMWDLFIVSLL